MASMLEDKDALRDLITQYCYLADTGQGDRWAALFVEDAVWDGGKLGRFEGRKAIRAHYEGPKVANRHASFNSVITVDGDEAAAVSYVMAYRISKEGSSLQGGGVYEDRFVKRDGRWFFKSRSFKARPTEECLSIFG